MGSILMFLIRTQLHMKKHAFIVGGTGMLWDVSLWLAAQGYHISVVARDEKRLQELVDTAKDVTPISLDYHDFDKFRKEIKKLENVILVVAWVHSSAKEVLKIIDQEIQNNYKMFHILGTNMQKVKLSSKCTYKAVFLGKKGNRWLTNQEISAGIIEAIKNDKETIVGDVS